MNVFDKDKDVTYPLRSELELLLLEKIARDLNFERKRNNKLIRGLSEISNLGEIKTSYLNLRYTLNHTSDEDVREQTIRELNEPRYRAYDSISWYHDRIRSRIDMLDTLYRDLNGKPGKLTRILGGYPSHENTAEGCRYEQYVSAYFGRLEWEPLWTMSPEIAEPHKECGGENPADENDAAINRALCTLMDYDLDERLSQFCD